MEDLKFKKMADELLAPAGFHPEYLSAGAGEAPVSPPVKCPCSACPECSEAVARWKEYRSKATQATRECRKRDRTAKEKLSPEEYRKYLDSKAESMRQLRLRRKLGVKP